MTDYHPPRGRAIAISPILQAIKQATPLQTHAERATSPKHSRSASIDWLS